MEAVKKTTIEGIFPLNYMQQGLLFHHLSNKEDQGYLNVTFILKGNLNLKLFEQAWNKTIDRHAILRTTTHWLELANPVLVTHLSKKINLTFLDWTAASVSEKVAQWEALKLETKKRGVDFTNGALLQLTVVKFLKDEFHVLWPNHHLLLDGWSSQIILTDVITFYEALKTGGNAVLTPIPQYKSYLSWLKNTNTSEAADFWKSYFKDFKDAPIFQKKSNVISEVVPATKEIILSKAASDNLRSLAKQYKVTLNTILQGSWSILLSCYFDTDDVAFGGVVSGRSGTFPNLHLLAGMFMNVQPLRAVFNANATPEKWFQNLQENQQKAKLFEHISLKDIASFCHWPTAKPMFDSILIVESFPQAKITTEERTVQLSDFKSGITSTYPVTMVALPNEELRFVLSVSLTDSTNANSNTLQWIVNAWKTILVNLPNDKGGFNVVKELVPAPKAKNFNKGSAAIEKEVYSPPRNETELKLAAIWETIFGLNGISIKSNFFEIGGKSLLAAQMINLINKAFGIKLAPTTLLEHATIETLAAKINNTRSTFAVPWKNVVPIKTTGTKPALFCIHAGGGHVFFYNKLTKYIDQDRPIFALQPTGIFDGSKLHKSIADMALAYTTEIQRVQPQGPYNLMVYCFSTAVGIEMIKLLKIKGHMAKLIVMDTMAEQENLTKARFKMRVFGFVKRFVKHPIKVVSIMVYDRYHKYILPFIYTFIGSEQEKNNALIKGNLITLYNAYNWQSFDGAITLILSEKPHELLQKETIKSWEKLAKGGIQLLYTKGNHRTLFEEPDVRFVSEKLNECML